MSELQSFASWIAIVGTCTLGLYFSGFLVYHTLKRTTSEGSWFLEIIEKHFAATIGVPLSAISAVCVVIALGATVGGSLEFSIFGLSFSGISGPVTLWLICFLATVFSLKLLWKCEKNGDAKD